MPTPIELLQDPVSLTVFTIYGVLIIWEALAPARRLPTVRAWPLKGIASFMMFFLLSSYLPILWSEWLAGYQLFDLSSLGTWAGAFTGLLVYEAGVYFYHRGLHTTNKLFLGVHQMHHSAERLDTFGAFWFSPLDMIGWTVLASLSLTLVIGVTPEAATLVLYATTFLGIFQHANVRTPRWLGYMVQRPESHSAHHERGVHARNYSDLPVFDILFGTFYNPHDFVPATGFYDGASSRVGEMLMFRDVSRPDEVRETSLAVSQQTSSYGG